MRPMTHSVASFVDGRWVLDAPGGTLDIRNPARLDEKVAEARLGDATSFVQACRAAREAQVAWARVPAPVRGRAIQQLGRLVEENAEALARIMTREIGKPIKESRGSVQEVIDTCNFFVSEGRRLYGMTVPSELPDKQLFTFRNPVGVAAIVTAGNFPVAVPSWYLVPALLCGNAVVWKPADYAAASAHALFELFAHGGGPANRCAVRPPPAAAMPRAWRQEPHGDPARRRPRSRRRGRAVQRLRHRGPALHVTGHRHRPRGRPRRLPRALHRGRRRRTDRRPHQGCRLRPDARRAVCAAVRGLARRDRRPSSGEWLDRGRAHHTGQPA